VTLCGTDGMVQFLVVRASLRGDSSPKEHRRSTVRLLTHNVWPSGRALTAMATDRRRQASRLPRVDWELYRRLKSEGRLNLLFLIFGTRDCFVPEARNSTARERPAFHLPSEHLAWRERWRKGRWIKLSWSPEERSAILRQDEAYRQANARWEHNHGPVEGGARLWHFSWRGSPRFVPVRAMQSRRDFHPGCNLKGDSTVVWTVEVF
jgi:hypothetical protein